MLPSGCLPLRIRRYVQKSKFDHFSPDSNVVAYRCKPFRDRQADSWDISLSDIAVDPICRTSLDSRCKEDPEKGEKIESPGYRFLWYLSVFLVNLVLASSWLIKGNKKKGNAQSRRYQRQATRINCDFTRLVL